MIRGVAVEPEVAGVETSVAGADGVDVTGRDGSGDGGSAVGGGAALGAVDGPPNRKSRPNPSRPGSSPAPGCWPRVTIRSKGATRVIPRRDFQPGCIADLLAGSVPLVAAPGGVSWRGVGWLAHIETTR
jgi:hypothetical protein